MDKITYRGAVYPWHCDHIGHMNVMWYAGKFDEATWNLFARLGMTPAWLREEERGMAAVQQNIAYKRELLAGDIVEVKSRVLEIRERSMRFAHDMWNAGTRELAASCEITGVHMDRRARKAVPFPAAVRAPRSPRSRRRAGLRRSSCPRLTRGSACRRSRRRGPRLAPPSRRRRGR
jgi:acyl-CoA thioester hydrolase